MNEKPACLIACLTVAMWMFGECVMANPRAEPPENSCHIASPPIGAGELFDHGTLLLVHPRASEIGPGYSGCQSLWQQKPAGPQLMMRVRFVGGAAVEYQTPDAPGEFQSCKKADLKGEKAEICRGLEGFPLASFEPGCVKKALEAGAEAMNCDER